MRPSGCHNGWKKTSIFLLQLRKDAWKPKSNAAYCSDKDTDTDLKTSGWPCPCSWDSGPPVSVFTPPITPLNVWQLALRLFYNKLNCLVEKKKVKVEYHVVLKIFCLLFVIEFCLSTDQFRIRSKTLETPQLFPQN